MKLGPKQLRKLSISQARELAKKVKRNGIYIILENVLDTYNIGAFFRLAEAVAAEKIYLCGKTATPPDPKIVKASVGNYKLVPWEYKKSAREAIKELRKIKGMKIISVEQSPQAVDYRKIKYSLPTAFILGSDSYGTEPGTLKLVDEIAEIPMYGLNGSLNVIVAAGIVLYRALAGDSFL